MATRGSSFDRKLVEILFEACRDRTERLNVMLDADAIIEEMRKQGLLKSQRMETSLRLGIQSLNEAVSDSR